MVPEIPGPTKSIPEDQEVDIDQQGSAESDSDDDFTNDLGDRNKALGFSTFETPNKGLNTLERSNHVAESASSASVCHYVFARLQLIAFLLISSQQVARTRM